MAKLALDLGLWDAFGELTGPGYDDPRTQQLPWLRRERAGLSFEGAPAVGVAGGSVSVQEVGDAIDITMHTLPSARLSHGAAQLDAALARLIPVMPSSPALEQAASLAAKARAGAETAVEALETARGRIAAYLGAIGLGAGPGTHTPREAEYPSS